MDTVHVLDVEKQEQRVDGLTTEWIDTRDKVGPTEVWLRERTSDT